MKMVRVIDSGLQYTTYGELGGKYSEYGIFVEDIRVEYGDRLMLIEYTEHLLEPKKMIAVCKDDKDRILLIGKEGVEEMKDTMKLICTVPSNKFKVGDIAIYEDGQVRNTVNNGVQMAFKGCLGVDEINKCCVPKFIEYSEDMDVFKVRCVRNKIGVAKIRVNKEYLVVEGCLYGDDNKIAQMMLSRTNINHVCSAGLLFEVLEDEVIGKSDKKPKQSCSIGDRIVLKKSIYGFEKGCEFEIVSIEDEVYRVKNSKGWGILSENELKNFEVKKQKREWTEFKYSRFNECEFRTNGRDVEVFYKGEKARSRCHKDDKFVLQKGIQIAKRRAQIKKLQREIKNLSK